MTISSPSCSLLYLFLAEGGDDNLHLQELIRRAKTDILTDLQNFVLPGNYSDQLPENYSPERQ